MAELLGEPREASSAAQSRPRTRLWRTTSLVSAGITLAQVLGAVLPNLAQDYRGAGPASFVPLFIVVALLLATLVGLVFGTVWWLGLLGVARITRRTTGNSLVVSISAISAVAAVAGGISAAIAPGLYTDVPLNLPWFDFASVALVTGAATSWLIFRSKYFHRDEHRAQLVSSQIDQQ